jgi:hypothetical protein
MKSPPPPGSEPVSSGFLRDVPTFSLDEFFTVSFFGFAI